MKAHTRIRSTTLSLLSVALVAGCSGGGPGGPPASPPPPPASPAIQVLPASYDFGKVTSTNTPAPLEVSIGNSGNAALAVSRIAFRAPADADFKLNVSGGAAACGPTPTIAPGMRCTVEIAFTPAPGSNDTSQATLEIASNATPSLAEVTIKGAAEPVAALFVRINQLQSACTNPVTAYVSVTDQGGYPVRGLTLSQFTVAQNGAAGTLPQSASYIDLAYQPIATAAALDFSNSLTGQPVAFADMKSRVSDYFSAMRTGDQGEVIKFGSEIQVTQAFTTDKSALLAAIAAPFDKGGTTKLYDAAMRAVDDAAAVPGDVRRAVILATDGTDNASAAAVATATANAASKGVPLFTVGIGSSINSTVLRQMADATGGLYYEATTSQNLATIYQQLSSILYTNQYVLRFDRATNAATTVGIGATSASLSGSGASALPACN
jgi:VWFA-related protein